MFGVEGSPDMIARGRKPPTVLVVEDAEDAYERFSDFLAHEGFSVVGASDGFEAVHEARRITPDLIVMDLGLPHCDGIEATRRLKQDPRTSHIPVLAVSGHSQDRIIELAHRVGCDAFLRKPCATADLLAEIHRFVHPRLAPILLVEDDDDARMVLASALDEEGFCVEEAANGREALDRLRSGGARPRLILLDLMMPVMDGWEFRAALRQDPALAEIPIVVLTAVPQTTRAAESLEVADILTKPIDLPHLFDTVVNF